MVTLQQMSKNIKTSEINQELASDIAWSQEKFEPSLWRLSLVCIFLAILLPCISSQNQHMIVVTISVYLEYLYGYFLKV